MKVHAILLSALAAAAMTAPADAGETKPSTIAAVEVTRNVPAGTFGGVAWRAIEGVIHGEASAAEPVAGLGALAAGRTSVPYAIAFRIALPATASDADAIVIEAPNRGNPIVARSLGAPDFAAVAGASPEAVAIGDGFLLRHGIALAALQWQAATSRRSARERAGDRRSRDARFRPLARRRLPQRVGERPCLRPSHPGRRQPERLVRQHVRRRRLQCRP